MEPLDISTATGETLTVTVEDEHVLIAAGDDVTATEAAHYEHTPEQRMS